ncbi:uncharacterized protein ACNLHF_019234 [Anomaloglossus baeobatrachus]
MGIDVTEPTAPSKQIFISPSLLPSHLSSSADLFLNLRSLLISRRPCRPLSFSHLLSLSLLLLTAGDIAPNPGPPWMVHPSLSPTHHSPHNSNYRNLSNIKTIPLSPTPPPPLSGALWNARSVCNKPHIIHDLFTSSNLSFLGITETWLTPSNSASPAALCYGGLHFSHTPRPGNRQGGGVGLLLSNNCSFTIIPPLPSLVLPSFETWLHSEM